MRKRARWIIAFVLVLLVGIQAVPVQRTNPAGHGALVAPADVADALRRTCFDCHSNETTWPWYSRVAPVSWLVSHDVTEGRQKLNFSNWEALSPPQQAKAKGEAREEIDKGAMPPWYYAAIHRAARLPAQDRAALEGRLKEGVP